MKPRRPTPRGDGGFLISPSEDQEGWGGQPVARKGVTEHYTALGTFVKQLLGTWMNKGGDATQR
jgi:hypothetical protein